MAVEKSTPCYICWFFTISLAIPSGILLTDAIKAGVTHLLLYKNYITQESDGTDSGENKTSQPSKTETPKQELPTVKLSPKQEIPAATPSPAKELSDGEVFIKVLPDKDKSKKGKSGYQTTLEICEYWKREYKKEATRKNATYMEAACNRLKSYE
jgi:hypothetical protein